MEKIELRKISVIDTEKDDLEREEYLKELGESLLRYLKTGVKNKQLDKLIFLEEEFREKYQKRFNIEEITDKIVEDSKIKLSEIHYIESARENNQKHNDLKTVDFSYVAEKTSGEIVNRAVEIINDNLYQIIKDASYLSHVNMLYEIYEQEKKLRKEEQEYYELAEKYQKIADILKQLSNRKRMEINELQRQINISQKELDNLLDGCSKYFNIRGREESIQISLSPKGRKFSEYILNTQNMYSSDTLNQLVYKNCDNLMEALENSYEKGMQYDVKFEGLNPDRERAIQYKYRRVSRKFVDASEDIYPKRTFIRKEKKVGVSRDNEKYRFEIVDDWDE